MKFEAEVNQHWLVWLFCLLGGLGLGVSAIYQSPVSDEFGHFFAGLSYWQNGDTDTFNVNPPLLRSLATLPAFMSGMRIQQAPVSTSRIDRPEFTLGRDLFIADPERFQKFLVFGRFVVVVASIFTGWLLFLWAREHGGVIAGCIASVLWFSQPQILSHGSLITGDVFCATFMLLSLWTGKWAFEKLSMLRAATLGFVVAIAILAKFTALILLPFLAVAFIWHARRYSIQKLGVCIVVFGVVMLSTFAVPYRWEGYGRSFCDHQFLSQSFSGFQQEIQFLSTYLSFIPKSYWGIPIPESMLLGLDRQQLDFEVGLPSYAAGLHSRRGWWWFYLYSMMVKMPLGTLLCICSATLAVPLLERTASRLVLWPLAVVLAMTVMTALKSGFAQQHRYILPSYPFIFLAVAVLLGRAINNDSSSLRGSVLRRLGQIGLLGCAVSVVGSVRVAPNWLGAFNFVAGGNVSGFLCLRNDASDWGQDTYRVRDWIQKQGKRFDVYVMSSLSGRAELRSIGADFQDLDLDKTYLQRPYWLIVSKTDYVNNIQVPALLAEYSPVSFIGGSHLVFFIDVVKNGTLGEEEL